MQKLFAYNEPDLFFHVQANVKELCPDRNARYTKRDDITSGRIFADIFGDIARYNVTARSWYIYDGVVWKRDVESMKTDGLAKILARSLLIYSSELNDENFLKYAVTLQKREKRDSMLKDARSFIHVSADDFDTQPYLFNTRNCVIDLKSGEPLEHDSALLLSKVANVEYNPDARSELFDSFLWDIMLGSEDKIAYLQKLFGYALTGENTQEQLFILYGSTTRNGKSTLCDTLEFLFGDYSMNTQPETLAQKKNKDSRTASGDIARLDGVRLLHCGEPPKRMIFDVALLKSLTGRDVITARHLQEREFEFVPVFKLFINTNFLPVVTDDSLFSSNRVKVITFDRHFDEASQDVHLKTKLQTPESLSAILNWCLEGLRRYYDDGERLTPPEDVLEATKAYRSKSDKIENFIKEVLQEDKEGVVQVKRLYLYYSSWCRENGFGTENKGNFTDELKSKGIFSESGTIAGATVRNVVKGYHIRAGVDLTSFFPPPHSDADVPPE